MRLKRTIGAASTSAAANGASRPQARARAAPPWRSAAPTQRPLRQRQRMAAERLVSDAGPARSCREVEDQIAPAGFEVMISGRRQSGGQVDHSASKPRARRPPSRRAWQVRQRAAERHQQLALQGEATAPPRRARGKRRQRTSADTPAMRPGSPAAHAPGRACHLDRPPRGRRQTRSHGSETAATRRRANHRSR